MEDVKVFTISELLQQSRPITATSSLQFSSSNGPHSCCQIHPPTSLPTHKAQPSDQPSPASGPTYQNPNPRILRTLNHPAFLVGTLTLPYQGLPSTSTPNFRCSTNNCFVFSDGSGAICCDILDFDVRIIGNKIRVVSWNFIPFKHKGGFLEIIKWSFSDSSSVTSRCLSLDSFPLLLDSPSACNADLRTPHWVHGTLESVSRVSVVPCTAGSSTSRTGGASSNIRGFFVHFIACKCELCKVRESVKSFDDLIRGQNKDSHSFRKQVIVYFCGSASSWHPVITKLIGNVVLFSGLKKKLVYIGKEESQLMYVTTDKAFLHVPMVHIRWLPCRKSVIGGKGECGAYTGIVKGIYMQGMVVELDKEVWLLLTDQSLSPPHSLRVGAVISVRNVHFVNPKFSWTKMLILGACSKTNINVESFSPLESGCHVVSKSQSLLGKFIESLAFSARLWVLLVVSCFRRKFAGILSEKEILGSKHKEGLVQTYTSSYLPSSAIHSEHGLLMDLCKHELSGCGSEPNYVHPKLILPISYFVSHCEATFTKMMIRCGKYSEMTDKKNQSSILSNEGRSNCESVRRILSSEDIGIILLGSLKISSSSGKLQLVDTTGAIDVVIPDLPSFLNISSIYEVNNYCIIMEGIPEQACRRGSVDIESFSSKYIFQSFPTVEKMKLAIYACFRLRNASCKNRLIYPCIDWKKEFEKLGCGTFHLLRVTHKFPVLQKFPGDLGMSDGSSTFAEAVVLPWDLFLTGEARGMNSTKVFKDEEEKHLEPHGSRENQENISHKRHKVDNSLRNSLWSGIPDPLSEADNESRDLMNGCSTLHQKCSGYQNLRSLSSLLEVPCLATINVLNNHSMVSSGFLCYQKANVKVDTVCETNEQKVLLEFRSESLVKYQSLQIGAYYIIKHYRDDLCNIKDSEYVTGGKVLVNSVTCLWSLSFLSHKLPFYIDPSHDSEFVKSCASNNKVTTGISHQIQSRFQMSPSICPETPSDVNVHSHADVLLEIDLKLLEEGNSKSIMTAEEVVNESPCVGTTVPASICLAETTEPGYLLPEGNLMSLHGYVEAVHSSGCCSLGAHLGLQNLDYVQQLRYSQVKPSICIHVSTGHCILRILGSLSKHAYLDGFGPGVDATFYRILQLGQDEFLLISVSNVVINSIMAVNDQSSHEHSNAWSASKLCDVTSLDAVSSGLISELIQWSDLKPMWIYCRVLTIHILVLEKKVKKYDDSPKPSVNIPLAGFVLDDGSSSCHCWAEADTAATFLRLHEEISPKAFGATSCWKLNAIGKDGTCSTGIHYVDKILKKHGRITVKNYGSTFDSSGQDLIFSVSSENVFSSSEEDLLKFLLFNACFGTIWTVQGQMMGLDAVGKLEKQLTEMEMTMPSTHNIWARQVQFTNPLAEARNMIQELQNG